MSIRNLDIIASHAPDDEAITPFYELLAHQLRTGDARIAQDVPDMIRIIQSTLGSGGSIRRLRLFGHGAPGLQNVGHLEHSHVDVTGVMQLDWQDLDCVIAAGLNTVTGVITLTNDIHLRHLVGRFERGGWAELHGCRAGEGPLGEALVKGLSQMWKVRVKAGESMQYAGGGLEGHVRTAHPDGTVTRR